MTTNIALTALQAAFVAAMREGEAQYLGARGDREIAGRIERITGQRIARRALIQLSQTTRTLLGAGIAESTAEAADRQGL